MMLIGLFQCLEVMGSLVASPSLHSYFGGFAGNGYFAGSAERSEPPLCGPSSQLNRFVLSKMK